MPGFGLGPWQLLAGGLADITLCSLLVYARCLALAGDPGGGGLADSDITLVRL